MKIILTILSTCVFIHSLFAQTTNIPDANFEQALIDLGIDSGTVDGVALTAALSNVTILNVSNKNISDLTGIESFVALTGLVCENNQLISLDLSQNTQLEYLECSNNQITSLDLSNNPLLYNLLCSDNQLTNLDISNINEMWNLSCYNNLLDTLDASNCAIRYLFCGHNALTYFDFKNDSIILEIECSYNQLTHIDLSNTQMQWVSCSDNQITSVNLNNAKINFVFYCSNNLLSSLDFSNSDLGHVACGNNQLTEIDLSSNTSLYRFSGNNNPLQCLNLNNGQNVNVDSLTQTQLSCISVHDVNWANNNITSIDSGVVFSTSCINTCTTTNVNLMETYPKDLIIYPNPAKDIIHIELGEYKNEINVSIKDISGNLITQKRYNQTKMIDLNIDLPAGIYIINVITDNKRLYSKKIIKTP